MVNKNVKTSIENSLRKQVEKDPKVKNAYLLVLFYYKIKGQFTALPRAWYCVPHRS